MYLQFLYNLSAVNHTFILPCFLLPVSFFLVCFSFLHLTSVSYCPTYFPSLSASTYNFIHFDFPKLALLFTKYATSVSSIEMFTHSELRFYNFPTSIFTFLTSFSIWAWLRPPTFWLPLYLSHCSSYYSPFPPPFDCFRVHFSFCLTYPFRVFFRIKNILYFAENEFHFGILRYLWFSQRC